ncbi:MULTISPECIES: bacterio-opsin activator domain-containing protein [Halorussus]|uniref:bacterio-opsin activator domain-containing protein n=1 Tax=Halorussus TaxID=1070314 RepID=UPI00209FE1FF|nr:bacterio-opsin activator domain-containing protein [Halorussus vallis]USZ74627.1 helix-turn-helix domain-containing protein [Halorussus vallis]
MAGDADYLTTAQYERLRRRTDTYREDLVVALAGQVGLRPSELTRVRPVDLREYGRGRDGETHFLLDVPEGDGESRTAYVPHEVAHDLRKYANANDVDAREPVVDVSARRVQMLVADVADRTDDLRDVTCRDLRQHFAHRLLREESVDPRVVRAVGGWASLESLSPYLDAPTADEVVAAFADESRKPRPGSPPGPAGRDSSRRPFRPVDARSDDRFACLTSLGEALAGASTTEEAEEAACERLADVYRGVWVCDERGEVRASTAPPGTDEAVAAAVADAASAADWPPSSDDGGQSAVTVVDEIRVAGPLAGCPFAVAPLRSSDAARGLLCVAADAFAAGDRALLADAGRRVGRTLTAIERKRLLLSDTGVELSLRTADEGAFLAAASADLGCAFELEGVVPVEDHSLLYFVTARGSAVSDVLERVSAAGPVDDARLVRDYGDDALFEFAVSGESIATVVVERGGTVRGLSAEDGVADVTGVFSRRVDVRRVVEAVEDRFPETRLRSKREIETPVPSAASVRRTARDSLTERQRTVLRAAYLAGYFEWPRGSTAEELAASMDVSSPTLHNHLRKAEQKVLDAVFDDADASDAAGGH